MAPSPISLIQNSVDMQDNYIRYRYGGTGGAPVVDPDQKIVGSHLPISKRNSTPISCATVNYQSVDFLKSFLFNNNLPHQAPPASPPLNTPPPADANAHRRLDRSHSEPVRPQLSPLQQLPPQVQPGQNGSSRYKTELCRPFGETGYCKYGEKCQFAHGKKELRNMTRHPKYKTELCRTFHTTGLCGYGSRCHFIHNADERRGPMSPPNGLVSPGNASPPMMSSGASQIPNRSSSSYLSSSPEQSIFSISPPSSLNGSPPTHSGMFLDRSFSLGGVADYPNDQRLDNGHDTFITPPSSPTDTREADNEKQRLQIFRNMSVIY